MAQLGSCHGEHLAIQEFAAELRRPFDRQVLLFSEFGDWIRRHGAPSRSLPPHVPAKSDRPVTGSRPGHQPCHRPFKPTGENHDFRSPHRRTKTEKHSAVDSPEYVAAVPDCRWPDGGRPPRRSGAQRIDLDPRRRRSGLHAFVRPARGRAKNRAPEHRRQDLKDVKTFLERQPAPPVVQPVPAKAAVSRTASPVGGVPSKSAGFVPLKGAAAYRAPAGDPVVFEAFPSHESIAIRMDFHAVLLPVLHNITPERRRTALSGDVSKKCIASSWRARMRRPGRVSGCRKSMRTPAPRGVSRLAPPAQWMKLPNAGWRSSCGSRRRPWPRAAAPDTWRKLPWRPCDSCSFLPPRPGAARLPPGWGSSWWPRENAWLPPCNCAS